MIGPYVEDRCVEFFRFGEHSALMKYGGIFDGFRHHTLIVSQRQWGYHFRAYAPGSTRKLRGLSPRR